MPCCAFAACIVGQILLAFGFVRKAFFGEVGVERNAAVEWRLGDALTEPAQVAPRFGLSARGLLFAATVEIVIVAAGVWALAQHSSHGAGHVHSHHASH